MQIQIGSPMGAPGLPEDISPAYEHSGSIVARCRERLICAQSHTGERVTFESIYRKFAPALRKIIAANAPEAEEARSLLRTITLQQTLPWNELESPDYEDSYTGAPIPRFEARLNDADDLITAEQLTAEMKEPVSPIRPTIEAFISEWQHYVITHKPYADEAMNRAFIAANMEWVGSEDDEAVPDFDERERIPEYFTHEGQVDEDFGELWGRAIDISDGEMLIGFLQGLAEDNASPANLARIFIWKMDQCKLTAEDAERIMVNHQEFHMVNGKLKSLPGLRGWIVTMWDELFDYLDACGSVVNEEMTEHEIRTEVDALFKEYIEGVGTSDNPIRDQRWVEGYIEAVMSGLPIRRQNDEYIATDAAWDAYRAAVCPQGQTAYLKRLSQGASRREAMRDWYREAYRLGVVKPSRPKGIKAIRPGGLVLTNDKFVSWAIALKIHNEEGFDFQDKRAQLKDILTEKGWGSAFAEVL